MNIQKLDRIWMPDSDVPARLLPIRVTGMTNEQEMGNQRRAVQDPGIAVIRFLS